MEDKGPPDIETSQAKEGALNGLKICRVIYAIGILVHIFYICSLHDDCEKQQYIVIHFVLITFLCIDLLGLGRVKRF
jgi:hypothetical protein